jgi:hypothetical protein
MTDRELLELARKDNGQAFHLAVKMKISIVFNDDDSVDIYYLPNNGMIRCWTQYVNKDNAEKIVRFGITVLATEILLGKEMK